MHELSIAEAIVRVALQRADGRRIRGVGVLVGHLRQVVPSALRFGFEMTTAGTVADGAELEIEEVPAVGVCRRCAVETRQRSFPLTCRECGGVDLEITRGEELRVEWLDVESPEREER